MLAVLALKTTVSTCKLKTSNISHHQHRKEKLAELPRASSEEAALPLGDIDSARTVRERSADVGMLNMVRLSTLPDPHYVEGDLGQGFLQEQPGVEGHVQQRRLGSAC